MGETEGEIEREGEALSVLKWRDQARALGDAAGEEAGESLTVRPVSFCALSRVAAASCLHLISY